MAIPSEVTEGLTEWKEDDASPPEHRLKDTKSAHELYISAKTADETNAANRVSVQEMKDGEPPYDDGELERLGHSEVVNINFGEGFATIEAALSSYNDLTSSVDVLANCHTPFGSESERPEWSRIISEEWHRMNKDWGRFEFNVQQLADQFVTHGVGIASFDNDIDWRWRSSGLGNFLLPRDTEACEEELDYAIALRRYPINYLNDRIKDEEVAKATGWKVEAVKKAIWNSYKQQRGGGPTTLEWEEFQTQIKNNDVYFGTKYDKVRVNHYYVREFDGTISHYIADEAGEIEDFLYKGESRFKDINDCLVIFTYGIGNGYYHGIRGLGYKIFPHIQLSNRLRGRIIESTILSTSLLVQPQNVNDVEQLGLVYYGPYAVVPPNMKVIERALPSLGTQAMPVVADLSRQIQNNTGSYTSRAVTPEGQERTKFEVQAQLQQEATLSTSAMNLFYLPWKKLHMASFRRAQNKDYRQDDPGGVEVMELKKRLKNRGVPLEAFYAVDRVEPVRAIGYGSPGNRVLALDEINQLSPQFDAVGRKNALRDRVAVRVGYEAAERYVPKLETTARQPVDAKIAELENAAMHNGESVTVQVGENDEVHLASHVTDMTTTVQLVTSEKLDPQRALKYFMVVFPHVQAHVDAASVDMTFRSKLKAMQKALFKIGQFAGRLQKQLIKQMQVQQAEMEAQAAGMQERGEEVSPELQQKMEAHQVAMKILVENSQTKMAIKMAEAEQKRKIRDVDAAASLARKRAERASDRTPPIL